MPRTVLVRGGAGLVVIARMDVDAGDALGAEHLEVASVVFEGELESEAKAAQVVDGALLELAGSGVVAVVAHDEQVPPELVALQPGQGLGLDPGRAAGEQDDAEVAVEQ